MKLVGNIALLGVASAVDVFNSCDETDLFTTVLEDSNVYSIDTESDRVVVSCPYGQDLIINSGEDDAKVMKTPMKFTCEESDTWLGFFGNGEFLWTPDRPYNTINCFPSKNKCPKSGLRAFNLYGKKAFREQPTTSENTKMFRYKFPMSAIQNQINGRKLTNELAEKGWTVVFKLKNPIHGELTSGSFGHVSTSYSGTLFSVSSHEGNRDLLAGSGPQYLYLSFKRHGEGNFDFEVSKMTFYVGEFASTQCLDKENNDVSQFGVIRDGQLVKWTNTKKPLAMDRTDILQSTSFNAFWSGYQMGLESGENYDDDESDDESSDDDEDSSSEDAWNPEEYYHVNDKAQVWTEQGFVQGTVRDNVMTFNGIPYAEAPVGHLRWMKTVAKSPWSGVFDATRSLDRVTGCLNKLDSPSHPDHKSETQSDNTSEDCLFMNIATPKAASLNNMGNRPVLVHIHGAAWEHLTGSDNLFNGNYLAGEEGAIVITINFRLTVFGWLSLTPAGEYAPGNQALWDVITALEWIKMNIHHFHGDAENITLMGESSGAHMVSTLMAMRPTEERGSLFNRAVLLSVPWMVEARVPGANQGQADHVAGQLMHFLGCSEEANPFGCAKQKSAKELLLAAAQCQGATVEGVNADGSYILKISTTISTFTEVIDGDLLDMQTFTAFQTGRIMDIDLITGTTTGEGTTFFMGIAYKLLGEWQEVEQLYQGATMMLFKDTTPNLLATYPYPCVEGNPMGPYCNSQFRMGQMVGDYVFTCPNLHLAGKKFLSNPNNNGNGRMYAFLFDNPVPQSTQISDWARVACSYTSCHSAEVPYIFGSFQKDKYQRDEDRPAYTDTVEEDWALSGKMRKYWGNFMWSGNPNDSTRPDGDENKNRQDDLACWQDMDNSVCDGVDGFHIHHFVTGTDPDKEMSVQHFKDTCQIWDDLDVWLRY